VYADVWRALWTPPSAAYIAAAQAKATLAGQHGNVMSFAKDDGTLPVWLAIALVASNFTLNTLNWVWFFKMISALQKRFEPAQPDDKDAARLDEKQAGVVAQGQSTAAEANGTTADVKQRKAQELSLEGMS
jgi:hypothetical protein